jgi:hypothetical protein
VLTLTGKALRFLLLQIVELPCGKHKNQQKHAQFDPDTHLNTPISEKDVRPTVEW